MTHRRRHATDLAVLAFDQFEGEPAVGNTFPEANGRIARSHDGLRIDHVYATPKIAARSEQAFVDRDERKGKQASDHAPVFCVFSES